MNEVLDPVEYASREMFDIGGRKFHNHLRFHYDTTRWNFRSLVEDFFQTDALEQLHESGHFDPRRTGKKNSLDVSKALRDAVAPKSVALLHTLIHECVARFIGPIRSIQPLPMMRVNFHGSRAILRFHADKEYGQTPDLVNLWIPVTRVYGSNSMYVESAAGACDFAPLDMQFGQAFIFRGHDLLHGTVDNDSGGTRITYDLRFQV
ncbi:MAG TPA: hypothetical protein VM555_06690 [Tahibacter sp.]|nr:hypothetical protein [Tahibacter sp.]